MGQKDPNLKVEVICGKIDTKTNTKLNFSRVSMLLVLHALCLVCRLNTDLFSFGESFSFLSIDMYPPIESRLSILRFMGEKIPL